MISLLSQVISERFRDEVLYNKALYKSTLLYFTFTMCTEVINSAKFGKEWSMNYDVARGQITGFCTDLHHCANAINLTKYNT